MIDFIQHLLAFVVALGILITFHEFGHFIVARHFDVKILRFSIGFGKPLWKKYFGKDKTELVVAAVPLGGYVKMLDEREAPVAGHELDRAFNRKPLSQRTAIVFAGPLFNFIFAILAYWVMYMIGLSGLQPVIGKVEAGSIAATAGLQVGDNIVSVDEDRTVTWTMVIDQLVDKILDGKPVPIVVKNSQGTERSTYLDLSTISIDDLATTDLIKEIGIIPRQFIVPAIIGEVQSGLPAEKAGLKSGDRVITVDGKPLDDWLSWVKYIRARPSQSMQIEIERNGSRQTLTLVPEKKSLDNGEVIGFIGASNQPQHMLQATESYGPVTALTKSIRRTGDVSMVTLRLLGKILTGQASYKNLSGPISIAQIAGDSAQNGLAAFLWFLGVVSISLGVLNLLPVPLLDGGHLMYYLVESIKGSPVSESIQIIGQQVGIVLLLGLMIMVFYNDITRVLG